MLSATFFSLSLLPPLSTVQKEPLPYGRQRLSRRALLGVALTSTSALQARAYDDRSSGIPEFKSVATQVGGDDFVSIGSAGLKYKEVRTGSGALVQAGDTVAIQFSGRCLNLNGKRFISTQDAAALTTGLAISEPFTFVVGSPTVIPGLSQAVVGMVFKMATAPTRSYHTMHALTWTRARVSCTWLTLTMPPSAPSRPPTLP